MKSDVFIKPFSVSEKKNSREKKSKRVGDSCLWLWKQKLPVTQNGFKAKKHLMYKSWLMRAYMPKHEERVKNAGASNIQYYQNVHMHT